MLTGLQRTRFGEELKAHPEDLTYLGAVIYHVLNALPPNSHEIDELQVTQSFSWITFQECIQRADLFLKLAGTDRQDSSVVSRIYQQLSS